MKRGWIVGGWLIALVAAAVPALWLAHDLASRNPMGLYVDPLTGNYTGRLYRQFLKWWVSGAAPVSVLALACLFVNRRTD